MQAIFFKKIWYKTNVDGGHPREHDYEARKDSKAVSILVGKSDPRSAHNVYRVRRHICRDL